MKPHADAEEDPAAWRSVNYYHSALLSSPNLQEAKWLFDITIEQSLIKPGVKESLSGPFPFKFTYGNISQSWKCVKNTVT